MSDWFVSSQSTLLQSANTNRKSRHGAYSTSEAVNAGLDLEMPGKTLWRVDVPIHTVSSNKVAEHILDERVRNLLDLVNFAEKSGIPEGAEEQVLNRLEDQELLRRTAAESIVLMKNTGGVLPI